MKVGINAGPCGDSIRDLDRVAARGFQVVRVDVQRFMKHDRLSRVEEVIAAGLSPFVVVARAEEIVGLPRGVDVELGSEPDVESNGWTTASYAAEAGRALRVADAHGVRLWLGAISNLHTSGFAFLAALRWRAIPTFVGVSLHRYPDGDPERPHAGFRDRLGEVERVYKIVGARPLAVSEVGYHTGPREHFWSWLAGPRRWSDDAVARHMAWEARFWRLNGARICIARQLDDGVADDALDRYGFRRADGSWKPVAAAFVDAGLR